MYLKNSKFRLGEGVISTTLIGALFARTWILQKRHRVISTTLIGALVIHTVLTT